MGEIKAGVTLMHDFCRPGSSEFQSYIDYISREEVQRNNAFKTYSLFNDYMDNPEKSTGLFTKYKNNLSFEDKNELKEVFKKAQENGSLMWQTVVSFDNQWLEQNHIYDSQRHLIDEAKLREVARLSINRMLEKEGMEMAVWSASFHYNTDNIHIHVATVEPYPTRKVIMYNGEEEYKGRFKMSSLQRAKSTVVNEIIQTKEINHKINHIIRKKIVESKEQHKLSNDPELKNKFIELYEKMPFGYVSENLFNYNNNYMQQLRPLVDEISKMYIEKYHNKEYQVLQDILSKQGKLYRQAYGRTDRDFEEGKNQDLKSRLGNVVLKEVREYERNLHELIKEKEIIKDKPRVGTIKIVEDIGEEYKEKHYSLELTKKIQVHPAEEIVKELEYLDLTFEQKGYSQNRKLDFKHNTQKKINSEQVIGRLKNISDIDEPSEEIMKGLEYLGQDFEKNEYNQNDSNFVLWYKYMDFQKNTKHIKKMIKALFQLEDPEEKNASIKEINEKIQKEIKENNPFTLSLVGDMYEQGIVREKEENYSKNMYKKALHIFLKDVYSLEEFAESFPDDYFEDAFNIADYVQYRIGKQYDRGLGIEENKKEAATWYLKSDTEYARYSLAKLYFQGEGVQQDYETALKLYKSAKSIPFAILEAAKMEEKGLGLEQANKDLAEKHYKKAFKLFLDAEKGEKNHLFEYQLGRMLYIGQGCDKDVEESIKYLERASEEKDVNAELLLCTIYIEIDRKEKIPEAVCKLEEISNMDNKNAINANYVLGKLYVANDEKNKYFDLDKGVEHLQKAADTGHTYAQYFLGKLYVDSTNPKYNLEEGIKYLEKAEEQGNEYAQYLLGKLYIDPDNPRYNLEKGIKYLEKAEEQGNEYAQYLLGKLYINPENPRYDLEKGIKYLEKAGMQHNEQAQYLLGELYLNSESSLYNPQKGITYIIELAKQGNEYAQLRLGCEYLKGTYFEKNINQAEFWLEKAQEQGSEYARDILININNFSAFGQKTTYNKSRGNILNKTLDSLQKSLEMEYRKNERIIKQYQIEQNNELEILDMEEIL